MGVNEAWVQPNGLLPNVAASVTRKLDKERWLIAEERTAELIACIQPNKPSEERRSAVAGYVQRLIMKCFPCQVFTFGSVPLKTYLPDGDIDLTAFSKNQNLKDTWANDVLDTLEVEEKREDAEFRVKEVQYIQAEVKIIKCLVENIVVDMSFNQLGGLCTLCFLEEVDHLISQNHLFKRSIILIKAWCYYESRILGAHHGLISTYALETLVLYIFHVFNNSFAGPLEVLYRFLEFFSNFDWENFCVSLWGPVPISQLPDITGNFFRIRSAFAFGAKKLAKLLECPKEHLTAEVNQFFMNTWERHGSCQRPDAPSPDLWNPQPPNAEPGGGTDNSRNHLTTKRKGHCEGLIEVSRSTSSEGASTTHSVLTGYTPRASNPSGVHHSFSQKNYSIQTISTEKSHNGLKLDYSFSGQEAQARHQFSRTRSSPELTETSTEPSARGRRTNKTSEPGKDHYITTRPDHINRRRNELSETSASHQSLSASSNDLTSLRHSSSQKSLDARSATNLLSPLNSYLGDGSEAQQDLQQEEQDLVNMMAVTRAHGFPGPINLASSHIPVSQPSFLGYSQRNFGGLMPTNLPFIDPAWASGMQFPPGIVSSQLAHYFSGLGLASSQEEIIDCSNESSTATELRQDSNDAACWSENDNASASGLEFASSQAGGAVGTSTRSQQQKFQNNRGADIYVPGKTANLKLSGNEVNSSKLPKSSREKWGRKTVLGILPTAHEKSKPSWQYEGDVSAMEDEVGNKDWRMACSGNEGTPAVPAGLPVSYEASTSGSETIIPGPMLVGSGSRQITFYPTGPPVPFVTMLPIYNFSQDVGNSSGSPRAFDRHEGSLENGHGNISEHSVDASSFAASENLDQSEAFVSHNSLEVSTRDPRDEVNMDILNGDFTSHWQNLQYGRICQSPRNYPPLIYSPQFVGPPVYLQGQFPWEGPGRPLSSTSMGLVSQIMSCGPRLVPVAPLQSSSSRPARVYQRFSEEMPRYRSGTGTYLPNPKPAQYRDRQSTNNMSHRGSYNYDRNEHGENDRSWNLNSKPRGSGRSQNRYDARTQADKLGLRSDHQRGSDTITSRLWDLYRRDGSTSFPTQNGPPKSANPAHGMGNVAYGMYPVQAVNSNGVESSLDGMGPSVPSVVMLYPYEHSASDTQSSQDQLEFGSLGTVQFGGSNEASQAGEGGSTPGLCEQQHGLFRGGSPSQSSPDQASAPQLQRRI